MIKVAPSILASDWGCVREEAKAVSDAGADFIHLDVMDGSFVPPITFGADFVKAVRAVTKVTLDVHLMIVQPERHIAAFADAGADIITVHQEASPHLHRTLQLIHDRGIKAGVAINPGTPVTTVKEVLGDIDLLLVMSVNPGWGGQAYIPHSTKKLAEAAAMIKDSGRDVLLEVDGGINDKTVGQVVGAGANVLVAGSYIFGKRGNYREAIQSLK